MSFSQNLKNRLKAALGSVGALTEFLAAVDTGTTAAVIEMTDANYTILAENSRKPHVIANVSADRTFSFPAEADGLDFTFVPDLNAADGHDWIFDTGSNTNYFTGGVVHLDTDSQDTGDEIVLVVPNGSSNSKFQVNLPQPGTTVRFICNGTTWNVSGQVVSATAPAFADQ